jgi:predicted Fe-Mo cluster-binding NifX family protein
VKVAVAATEKGIDGNVAGHFGNATYFVVAEIEEGKVKSTELVKNPHAGRHVPGALPKFMKELKAEIVITGDIGPLAIEHFNDYGIKFIMNVKGNVKEILEKYAQGKLEK